MKKKDKEVVVPSSISDDKWRAECDARTLVDAETIKNDKERLSNALDKMKDEHVEAKKKVTSMEELLAKKKALFAAESNKSPYVRSSEQEDQED